MARASTYTLLPLDSWAAIMGIDRFEFNQIGTDLPVAKQNACQRVFFQYAWQKDYLSREEVAQAIADAERMMAEQLRFYPAPKYFIGEIVQYPRPYQRNLFGYAGTPRGEWKRVQLAWHRFQTAGVLNRTSIGTGNVVQTDPDGDAFNDGFSVTIATTVTNANEIGIYFTATDRNNVTLDETWRIRPVNVTISGGNAVITGGIEQLVKPDLTLEYAADNLSATNPLTYVTQVEVYRVFTDTTATDALPYQGVGEWDAIPGCVDSSCGFEIKPICLSEWDASNSVVWPAFGLPCAWPQNREPDRLSVNYLAGLPLVNGQMQKDMARAVAYLAASLLASEKCGCERSNRILAYWRTPLHLLDSGQDRGFTQKELESNPFDAIPSRGSIFAWKRATEWRDTEMISL